MPDALPVGLTQVVMVAEQTDGPYQQVVKVQRVVLPQQLFVARVDAAHDLAEVAGGGIGGGRGELVLGRPDGGQHPPGGGGRRSGLFSLRAGRASDSWSESS